MSIWVLRVQLDCSSEKFESLFVFFLKGETISNSDPGFRGVYTFFQGLMGEIAEVNMSFHVPQTARVVLYSFQAVRLKFVCLFVVLGSLRVLDNFHVGSSNVGEYPACIEVVLRQFFKLLDSFEAMVETEQIISLCELSEQSHQT